VALLFEDVRDLYGLEVHLAFDPEIIEVVDADAGKSGVQIMVADWLQDAFVAANRADNAAGRIDFGATLLNPAPPVSGSKTFATVTLRARGDGTAPLTIEEVILATRDAEVIETRVQHGQVGVSASGKPPVTETGAKEGGPAGVTSVSRDTTALLVIVAAAAAMAFMIAVGVLGLVLLWSRRRT
jgi:hypothetical protein